MLADAKILHVDLSMRTHWTERLSGEEYRKYPGGSALGMYLLLRYGVAGADPLGKENLLIFSVSPLTGIPISGQSRMTVTTKSPLTGTAGDSQVGGFIPAHLKGNGYDSIVCHGKANTPVYLYINKDQVEIRDASAMWGTVTGVAEAMIQEDLGISGIESSIIGPAGEQGVSFASIIHMRSRANGRNGVGAVMGSKNMKALVVKRQTPSKPIDMDGLKTLTANVKERMAENAVIMDTALNGTAGVVDFHADEGFLPSYNWARGTVPGMDQIRGTTLTNTVLQKRDTCFGCAVRCKGVVDIPGKADPSYGGPEYETIATFGSYCGNADLASICEANQLCNMYGIDTISCGATIAFAMECFENGLLTLNDTDGLPLNFGNAEVFAPLIKKIAYRDEGIGALLAQGSYRAAQAIGQGADAFVMTCKRQEIPAHMVQMKPNLAINYAVNPFGADHQSSEHDPALMAPSDSNDWLWSNQLASFEKVDTYGVLDRNKAKFALVTQQFYSALDTLCLCQFVWGPAWQLYGPNELVSFCKFAADWDASIQELLEIGERRINMMRLFNAREGIGRQEDTLPERMFIPVPDGPNAGVGITREEFDAALEAYYEMAGWDTASGLPTEGTIQRLGLEWIQ